MYETVSKCWLMPSLKSRTIIKCKRIKQRIRWRYHSIQILNNSPHLHLLIRFMYGLLQSKMLFCQNFSPRYMLTKMTTKKLANKRLETGLIWSKKSKKLRKLRMEIKSLLSMRTKTIPKTMNSQPKKIKSRFLSSHQMTMTAIMNRISSALISSIARTVKTYLLRIYSSWIKECSSLTVVLQKKLEDRYSVMMLRIKNTKKSLKMKVLKKVTTIRFDYVI